MGSLGQPESTGRSMAGRGMGVRVGGRPAKTWKLLWRHANSSASELSQAVLCHISLQQPGFLAHGLQSCAQSARHRKLNGRQQGQLKVGLADI